MASEDIKSGSSFEVQDDNASEKTAVPQTSPAGKDEEAATGPAEGAASEPQYPRGLSLVILTLGLMLVVLMIALDNYIIATAIPAITSDFHSLADIGWYGSSYFLTQMAFQPAFGKIYLYYDIKTSFAVAIVIFEVGSALSAAAVNSPMFIIGRVVAGVGGGGLFVGTIVMVGYAVAVHRRPVYISLVTSMYGVASVAGPLLGGAFTDSAVTWRFCFYVNLPIGLVSFLVIVLFCRSPAKKAASTLSLKQKLASLDLGGGLLLTATFVCLLLATQWGGVKYAWNKPQVWTTLLAFGLGSIAFVALQIWQKERAGLPVRLFRDRTVVFGFLFTVTINIAVGVSVYWIPLYYQAVRGFSAVQSGIHTIPFLTPLLFAPMISGFSITKFGYYVPFMWTSGILATVGTGLLVVLSSTTSKGYIIAALVIAGFGAGFGRQIGLSAMQHVLPAADVPLASSLFSFGVALGGTLATCLSQAVFLNGLAHRLAAIPGLDDIQAVVANGATNLSQGVPAALTGAVEAAAAGAIADTYKFGTVFAGLSLVCSLGMKWANIKH